MEFSVKGKPYKVAFEGDGLVTSTANVTANKNPLYYELKHGDIIRLGVNNPGVREAVVGEKYLAFPAIVIQKEYTKKRWWQFWKRKELLWIDIMWKG